MILNDFAAATAGVLGSFILLKDSFRIWENVEVVPKVKPLFKAMPMFILWKIWKRNNAIAHEGRMSVGNMKMEINRNIILMAKCIYSWLRNIPTT